MTAVVVRNIVGFVVQVAPAAAALCLMPFDGRFRCGTRRAWLAAGAIVAVGLVPFLAVALMPLAVPDGAPFEVYNPLQNLVFLATVAALFVLYVRVVDARAAHKAFVFSLVMLYGFLVTLISSNVSYLLGFAEQSDGFMYYPPRLVVLALTNAVFFGAMAAIMRSVRRSLAARLADSTWWHMTALLLTIVGTLLLGAWLPPLDYAGIYFTLCFVIAIDCVALVGWLLRTIREASEQAERQATLERAPRHTNRARDELAGELARAHERVAELERRDAADPDETPVVLATPAQAVSFLPDEVSYVDSLNRVRAIHFADGESIQMNMTLAQIAEALPKGHFAYCHRSIVVNLRHVRSVGPTSLALNDGTELPVSRRRLAELRETLSGIQAE